MLKVAGDNPYGKRMTAEYRRRWPELHAKTVQRVQKATANLRIAGYFAGDCREFLAKADRNAVCISFPPTYEGGYERLFKKLDAIFDWPRPAYQVFSPEDFEQFSQTVRSSALDGFQRRRAARWPPGTSPRYKPLCGPSRCTCTATRLRRRWRWPAGACPQPVGSLTDEVVEPVQVVRIDARC